MSDEQKQQDPREYWAGFPEAPFSTSFKWVDANGFEQLTTLRGWQFSTMFRTIGQAEEIITMNGGMPINNRPQPAQAPTMTKDVKIAMDEGNKQLAADLQAQALDVPQSRKGADVKYQTVDVEIVEVLPQPDNKVTLKFYGANDKYPRVSVNKWKVEQANGLMKHVTAEDMGKAAKYSLKCRVYFTDGASYTSTDGETRHYKDVEHVRPL